MGETKFVPRWLPQRVTIPAGATRPLPASGFANTELWPWRLHWMSVTGVPKLETDEDPRRAYMGGVASRLTWQLGISQKGDINLRTLTTDAMPAGSWPASPTRIRSRTGSFTLRASW